jgi:hypothetical protein
MADKSPPCRASSRPLAGVLGCLAAACAPAEWASRAFPAMLFQVRDPIWLQQVIVSVEDSAMPRYPHHLQRPAEGPQNTWVLRNSIQYP